MQRVIRQSIAQRVFLPDIPGAPATTERMGGAFLYPGKPMARMGSNVAVRPGRVGAPIACTRWFAGFIFPSMW
jgi:hypothetical protein